MRKFFKYFGILIVIVLAFTLGHVTTIHYSIEGTYSAGTEPSKNNIYLAIGHEKFELYTPECVLETGRIKKVDEASKLLIYSMISWDNEKIGYVIQYKNSVVLLNIEDKDLQLKKISNVFSSLQ